MKIKSGFLKGYNRLISIFLVLLGFSTACEDSPLVEYGTPYATFIIKGNVKSEQYGSAISNIRVIMNPDNSRVTMRPDTSFTDTNGIYKLESKEFPDNHKYLIVFRDVDGETNGQYQTLDTAVEFNDPIYTEGSGNWFRGKTEKELNVLLKLK